MHARNDVNLLLRGL